MRYNRPGISFSNELLTILENDKNSCVEIQRLPHHIALQPYHFNELDASIRYLIKQDVAKYSKTLGGILMGAKNLKLMGNLGQIIFDTFFIHVDVQADFYLFKPEVGKELKGIVTKKTKDHVSCLLYNAFNISLPRGDDGDDWIGHEAEIGQEISFRITLVNFSMRYPYIRGQILGNVSEERKETVRKRIVFDDEDEEETNLPSSSDNTTVSKKRKIKSEDSEGDDTPKAKKRRLKVEKDSSKEESDLEYSHDQSTKNDNDGCLPITKSKKKKKDKSRKNETLNE